MKHVICTLFLILCSMLVITFISIQPKEAVTKKYWPSVHEMQEWSDCIKIDGIWGDETELKYKKKQERWYCDYMYQQSMNK